MQELTVLSRALPAAMLFLAALAASCGGGGGGGDGGLSVTGGGGGRPSPPRPSTVAPAVLPRPAALQADAAPYESNTDYRAAWGLAQIGAATAYARIADRDGAGTAPGAGAHVAVIDDGIDIDDDPNDGEEDGHWEFLGLTVSETCPTTGGCGDRSHGTSVSSIIAAQRNPSVMLTPQRIEQYNFHGVAWGIDRLDMLSIPLGSADPDANYVGAIPARAARHIVYLAELFAAAPSGVDFVNMSFGVSGLVENYEKAALEAGHSGYRAAVNTLAQTATSTGKTILVIAAGNSNGRKCAAPERNCVGGRIRADSPSIGAGLPVLEESLRSHLVAVVATDRNRRIASFSNRCGIAAKWCIAAPGGAMWVAGYFGTETDPMTGDVEDVRGYRQGGGTSFAAPHVTGGLAVLKHWFNTPGQPAQLANEELLERLYLTARVTPDPVAAYGGTCPEWLDLNGDLRRCELSSVFGRGLMDLGAATAPVGSTTIALGGRVAEGGAPAASSRLLAGRALGDAFSRSLAGRQVALFDELGAPFWTDAAGFAGRAEAPGPALRLSRWLADMAADAPEASGRDEGLRFHMDAPEGAHMGLASRPASAEARFGDLTLSAFASTGADAGGALTGEAGALGLALAWRPDGGPAGLGLGRMAEAESFLGARAEGAFGTLSSRLDFVRAGTGFEAGGWRFEAAAELGRALPEAEGGLLAAGGGDAFSTAFSTTAARPVGKGTLRLSLQQPLRVESGHLDLPLPVGRTPEGTVRRERVRVGLEPSGRQLDFGIDWTQPLAPGAAWRIGAVLSRDPGHDAGHDAEAVLLAGLRIGL